MGFIPRLKKSPSRLILILLALAGIYFIVSFTSQIFKSRDLLAQADAKRREIQTIEAENAKLMNQLAFAQSDGYLQYVERVAREQLNMSRPDETTILVVPPTSTTGLKEETNDQGPFSPVPPAGVEAPKPKPNWQHWSDIFGGVVRP